MKAKIKLNFSAKNQAEEFCPVEENDSIELEIEYENDQELSQKIDHWQDFLQNKVINATMTATSKFREAKQKQEKDERKIQEAIEIMNDKDDEDEYEHMTRVEYEKAMGRLLRGFTTNSSSCSRRSSGSTC